MTEQEQKAFDQMREAQRDAIIKHIEDAIKDHCSGSDLYMSALVAAGKIQALTAANAVSEQPQAQGEGITLQRWGRAENLCLRLLDPMEDGYWTPWHIAQEAIDSLQKNIAHPQATEPAWSPIETAPKDGSEILAFNGENALMHWIEVHSYAAWEYADKTLCEICPEADQPTHWMPLPAAPEAKQ